MEDDVPGGDPVEPRTQLVLADYTWLPAEHQLAFQQTLEQDEGVALCYFLAEAQRLQKHDVQEVVLLLSTEALYVCSPAADIYRCILVEDVRDVLVCDEWICLVLPNSYDLAFRFSERNNSRFVAQRPFLEILNKLRLVGSYPPAHVTTVTSQYALTSRQLTRPALSVEARPLPIPILSYDTLRTGIFNANRIIDALTFQHRLRCPRQNRTTTRIVLEDPTPALKQSEEKFAFSFVSPKQQQQQQPAPVQPPAPIASSPEMKKTSTPTAGTANSTISHAAPHMKLHKRPPAAQSHYMDRLAMPQKVPYDASDFTTSSSAQTPPADAVAAARKLDARLNARPGVAAPTKSPARVSSATSPAPASRFKSPTVSSKKKERLEMPTAPSSVANMSALSHVPSSLLLSQTLRSSPTKKEKQAQRPLSPTSPRSNASGLDTSQRITGRVLSELEEQRRSIDNLTRQIEFLMAKTRRASDASPPRRPPQPSSPRPEGAEATALPRPGSFSNLRGRATGIAQLQPMTPFQRDLAHMSLKDTTGVAKGAADVMRLSGLNELVRGDTAHHHESSTRASRTKQAVPTSPRAGPGSRKRPATTWASRW